jgi:hypothetical protein
MERITFWVKSPNIERNPDERLPHILSSKNTFGHQLSSWCPVQKFRGYLRPCWFSLAKRRGKALGFENRLERTIQQLLSLEKLGEAVRRRAGTARSTAPNKSPATSDSAHSWHQTRLGAFFPHKPISPPQEMSGTLDVMYYTEYAAGGGGAPALSLESIWSIYLYGKSWELNLLKPDTNLHQFT